MFYVPRHCQQDHKYRQPRTKNILINKIIIWVAINNVFPQERSKQQYIYIKYRRCYKNIEAIISSCEMARVSGCEAPNRVRDCPVMSQIQFNGLPAVEMRVLGSVSGVRGVDRLSNTKKRKKDHIDDCLWQDQ